MTTTPPDLFRGAAGRRTFLSFLPDLNLVAYRVSGSDATKTCSPDAWRVWCDGHAPLCAEAGLRTSQRDGVSAEIVEQLPDDEFLVAVTRRVRMTRAAADRLVRRLGVEEPEG